MAIVTGRVSTAGVLCCQRRQGSRVELLHGISCRATNIPEDINAGSVQAADGTSADTADDHRVHLSATDGLQWTARAMLMMFIAVVQRLDG